MADLPDTDPTDPRPTARLFGIRGRDIKRERVLVIDRENGGVWFASKGDYHEVRQTQNEQEIFAGLLELMEETKSLDDFSRIRN